MHREPNQASIYNEKRMRKCCQEIYKMSVGFVYQRVCKGLWLVGLGVHRLQCRRVVHIIYHIEFQGT